MFNCARLFFASTKLIDLQTFKNIYQMEKINVVINFTLGDPVSNGLDKLYVKCEKVDSVGDFVSGCFDLLPNYPLENYVRFMLTKYHQAYGTQNQNPPQKE